MTACGELLTAVLEATAIHSATSYSWFGTPVQDVPRQIERTMSPSDARDYLLYRLQMQLYNDFYCRGAPTPSREPPARGAMHSSSPFVEALSAANSGRGSREPGWLVRAVDHRAIVVERDGLQVWVRPQDVFAPSSGIIPGARIRVRLPKELLNLFPGFYMTLGDEGISPESDQALIRFYWNVTSTAAPHLVRAMTTRLNKARLPFRMKVVNEPERFTRCDAAVLYVRKADHRSLAQPVREIYRELAGDLKPAIPAFTKQLAPGLGFAEDPGGGDSFGTHRCRLLADGIIRAHESGCQAVSERLRVVAARFEETGITLEQPFLNAGSVDVYAFRLP